MPPTEGEVRVKGLAPLNGPPEDVVIVFQDYANALLQWRTVAANVAFGIERTLSRADCDERVREALSLVGLQARADDFPWQLSGGMQQRVQIARALALRPAVMLMDEPFAALDAMTKASLQDELLRLRDRTHTSLVFITHDIEEAVYLGDQGRRAQGKPRPDRRDRHHRSSFAARPDHDTAASRISLVPLRAPQGDRSWLAPCASRVNVPGLAVFAAPALSPGSLPSGRVFSPTNFVPAPSAVLVEPSWNSLATARSVARCRPHAGLGRDRLGGGDDRRCCVGPLAGLLAVRTPVSRWRALEVLRPLPGIAFAPVALLLFGFSRQTELAIIILPALWPAMVNTMGGIANVQPRLADVGRTFRLSRFAIVWRLLLPAALPSIIIGARISLGLALVMAIVAEIVGNPEGLGYAIVREQQSLHPDYMFANIAIVGILGILAQHRVFCGSHAACGRHSRATRRMTASAPRVPCPAAPAGLRTAVAAWDPSARRRARALATFSD